MAKKGSEDVRKEVDNVLRLSARNAAGDIETLRLDLPRITGLDDMNSRRTRFWTEKFAELQRYIDTVDRLEGRRTD